MEARDPQSEPPLVVIVGPTASGKTSLAIELAGQYHGEIICADSRTVYKSMDIGTAKPTLAERRGVPHWGLDLVDPDASFTVVDFQKYAFQKIAEIRKRGRVPFLVGGTGLYIDAILFDYKFDNKPAAEDRIKLNSMTVEDLHYYCIKNNIDMPTNHRNKRHLIRAIEQKGINKQRRSSPLPNSIVVGISTDKQILLERINQRSYEIVTQKVVNEATKIAEKYGWDSEAMTGNIYPLIKRYHNGEVTLNEARSLFVSSDRRLAKRQLTWFRRNVFIEWLPLDEAGHYLRRILAKQ